MRATSNIVLDNAKLIDYDKASGTTTSIEDELHDIDSALDGHKFVVMSMAQHDALVTELPAGTLCFCYEDT